MCRKPVGTGLPDGPSCEHAKQRAIRESIYKASANKKAPSVRELAPQATEGVRATMKETLGLWRA